MSTVAQDVSEAAAAAVESGGRSVVRVEGRRRRPSSGIAWAPDAVVAAHHTLDWDEDVHLGLPDGRKATAAVVGRDPTTDIAVLRVQGETLAPPAWSEPQALKVGHFVLALSRPGRTVRAALGVVNALGDEWRTPAGGRVDRYLQSDLTPYSGFSGGLLVDLAGTAVGMNTAGLMRGVATAIPVPTLRRVVESLLTHGQVRRGYLGIATFAVRLPSGVSASDQSTGLLVTGVQPGSPAAEGGLLLGDVLYSVEGRPVTSAGDLLPFLEEDRIGSEIVVQVLRAGQTQELRLRVGAPGSREGDA